MNGYITVIGAGLAGCEAAYQAARRGVRVLLMEMKPEKYSPAHTSPDFAELVCSNSLRSDSPENAVGLLKAEMAACGSLIMEAAEASRIPAGSAFAVDRAGFSRYITEKICAHPLIEIAGGECTSPVTGGITVVATGPLTSDALAEAISGLTGSGYLNFYDAAAPIVSSDSVDPEKSFRASRYGKGGDDYINCPLGEGEYRRFYDALVTAQTAHLHEFESDGKVFEGCMPVEVMALRGFETLLYGPMKPVGLTDPRTGEQPYAVVQLRQDDAAKSMYNIVGFQTHLTFGEQRRVFGMIPALEKADFLRYGVMHRNIYIDSPRLLDACYRMRAYPDIFFAGQITGVEGYVESASSGLTAGINAARVFLGEAPYIFPRATAIGALAAYVSNPDVREFQPMNVNYGIIEYPSPLPRGGKKAVRAAIYEKSMKLLEDGRAVLSADCDTVK